MEPADTEDSNATDVNASVNPDSTLEPEAAAESSSSSSSDSSDSSDS
ncbi:unnamed protein product, partial [Allacma fusca]